ncbi:MAG: hypothetical protein VX988_08110 [Planctomycetota bacterium]|nr:hypothetical protein [Planctomycetota bacterium]
MRGNLLFVGLLMVVAATTNAEELPVVFQEDFEKGADRWEPTDAAAWKIEAVGDNSVYSQFKKQSKYKPPHRSPYNIALIRGVNVGDFVLTARVRSTHPDYGHRDVCLFFGYQDAAHFHYVHLGKKADAHANQIFIVNKAPRTKISITTTKGTNWDDQWHSVKIIRTVQDGRIEVYFDDMKKPVMTAKDTTFQWGRVGLGSFDDTGHWDDIVLRGKLVKKP